MAMTKALVHWWIIWEENQWRIEWFRTVMVFWSSLKLFLGICWWLSLLLCMIMNWCAFLLAAHSAAFPLKWESEIKIKWKFNLKADSGAGITHISSHTLCFYLFVQEVCVQFICAACNCQWITITSSDYNRMHWQQEMCVCLKEDVLTQYLCLQSLAPALSSLTPTELTQPLNLTLF